MIYFVNYRISLGLPNYFPKDKIIVNTINPHSYCVAKKDIEFEKALLNSDYLFPDGIGIVWAVKFLYNFEIQKISGFDVHFHFLNSLNNRGCGKVFYLGSSNETLTLIKSKVCQEFPNLTLDFFSPPFKSDFTYEENMDMISRINFFKPDLLFVGMTAPKQEKWVSCHRELIYTNVICSVGAVFDFYAGTVKRPSNAWIKLGLEWFIRFLNEPKRLWKRNLISTPKFIFEMLRIKINLF